tara:strand:+ start:9026 stop:10201 length:1176 start_codon:yes stop_codon:yes gene_type:complete
MATSLAAILAAAGAAANTINAPSSTGRGGSAYGSSTPTPQPPYSNNAIRSVDARIPAPIPRDAGVGQLKVSRPDEARKQYEAAGGTDQLGTPLGTYLPNTGSRSDQARATEFGLDVLDERNRQLQVGRQTNPAQRQADMRRFLAMETDYDKVLGGPDPSNEARRPQEQAPRYGNPYNESDRDAPDSGYPSGGLDRVADTGDYEGGFRFGTDPLGKQLALQAAALASKPYVRADAFTSGTADPMTNTSRAYWEGMFPDFGIGEPYGLDRRGSALGPDQRFLPKDHRYTNFGPISRGGPPSSNVDAYPQVTGSQFGPYQATAFNPALNTSLSQGPMSGPQHLIPIGYDWYEQDPRQTHPTGGQINRARAANALRAQDHYNRAWAAGPSYGGGY